VATGAAGAPTLTMTLTPATSPGASPAYVTCATAGGGAARTTPIHLRSRLRTHPRLIHQRRWRHPDDRSIRQQSQGVWFDLRMSRQNSRRDRADLVAEVAYFHWLNRTGSAEKDWLKAEIEVPAKHDRRESILNRSHNWRRRRRAFRSRRRILDKPGQVVLDLAQMRVGDWIGILPLGDFRAH